MLGFATILTRISMSIDDINQRIEHTIGKIIPLDYDNHWSFMALGETLRPITR